jgi:hypothetical protein
MRYSGWNTSPMDRSAIAAWIPASAVALGELGPPFFPPMIAKVATALPQVERKTFAGVGHEPDYDAPERYVGTIRIYHQGDELLMQLRCTHCQNSVI